MKILVYLVFFVTLYSNEIIDSEKKDSIEILRELKQNPKNYKFHVI